MIAVARSCPGLHVTHPGFLIARVLGSVSRVKVLGTLLQTGKAMSGREVARRARMPSSTAAQALRELVQTGIVRRTRVEGKTRYALNEHHHLLPKIRVLFDAENTLPDAIAVFLTKALRERGTVVRKLALSFSEKGEVLVLVDADPPFEQETLSHEIIERYGVELRGFVSNPAAGSECFGVWQEFTDEHAAEDSAPEHRPAVESRRLPGAKTQSFQDRSSRSSTEHRSGS